MSKKLVAYFSASGVTEKAAKKLAEAAGADVFEIRPKIPYTDADLNWMNKNSRSSVEMNNPSSRPEIADRVSEMDSYDVVFIGYPIWWYTAPTIIQTFLESYDFSGKIIIPFATSGGSGIEKSVEAIRKNCNGKVLPGKMLNGHPTEEALKSWIDSLISQ